MSAFSFLTNTTLKLGQNHFYSSHTNATRRFYS